MRRVQYVHFTKTDGAQQQPVFVRSDSVLWVQGASPPSVPVPEEAEPSGSGAILHFGGDLRLTVTVVESVQEVVRKLETSPEPV